MSILRVLVDDIRGFKDGRDAVVLRTSTEAVAFVRSLQGRPIGELWLDHDLLGDDTVQPLVDHLLHAAASGHAVPIGRMWVHSANIRAGRQVLDSLQRAGYPARRCFAANLWRHSR